VDYSPPYIEVYGLKAADLLEDNEIYIYIAQISVGILKPD
jgi:hypothetical protein